MNLESWLKQSRPLPENLRVIEALCSALNDAHARGVVHPALDPSNVDLPPEGGVSLAEAVRGVPGRGAPRYQAPEILEGGPASAPSDIYAAGVIFYEMLSGKSPAADRPTPLGELRPELSRDLTDAVMGCLEKGPDWRPKDLSYLAQVVAESRGSTPPSKPQVTKAGRSEAPRLAPTPPGRRSRPREPASRSQVPLIAGALMIVVLASAGGWFWLQSQRGGLTQPTPRPSVTPPPSPTPSAIAGIASPTPTAVIPRPTPDVVISATPTTAPIPTPVPASATPTPMASPPVATPTPRPIATPPPVTTVATPPPPTAAPATPRPATPTPGPPAATPTPLVPASLTAVTPLTVKRGAQHMIDVRGTALRTDHITRFYRQGAPADGLSVAKVKWVDPTLLKVLIQVDEKASPGPYSIAILDPKNGAVSNLLTLTVTK